MNGTQRYLSLLGVAAAFGATMIAPATASTDSIAHRSNTTILTATPNVTGPNTTVQWYRHRARVRRHHHRYSHRYSHRYYYRSMGNYSTNTSAEGFPNYYPNIQYFRRNGHIYYRNLDTGEVFLSQW